MARAIIRRVGQAAVTVLASSLLVWSLLALAPGDPARRVLAAHNVVNPNAEQVAAKRAELG
ncbi:MAG: ABC transporter permease, partial [Anaerolineales bacterium]